MSQLRRHGTDEPHKVLSGALGGSDGAFSIHWQSYGFPTIVFCVLVMFAVMSAYDAGGWWIGFALRPRCAAG